MDSPLVSRQFDLHRARDANDQLGSRRQYVSGLQVSGERDVELFSLEDLHRDPLFQSNDMAQQVSGENQAPSQQNQYSEV